MDELETILLSEISQVSPPQPPPPLHSRSWGPGPQTEEPAPPPAPPPRLPGARPAPRPGPAPRLQAPPPGRRRACAGAEGGRGRNGDCSGGSGGGRGGGAQPEPRRRVARPGRGRRVEPGERVHVRAAEEGHRARQAARYLLFNGHCVVGRHHCNGCWPDWKLPGLHGGPHRPGDAPGCPWSAVWVHFSLLPSEGETQHLGQVGVSAQLCGLCGTDHPLPEVRECDHAGRAGGEADQPSVRGLPVHCAPHAATAHLLDRAGARAHQHHGLYQHLLPAGELHRAFHQGHRAGGPRHLPQQPVQPAGPLPVPGAPGRARLQHHRPVQIHQQGARVLRLLRVRGHLLRGLHHAGPAGLRHPVPGVEQRGPGGLPGDGLRLHHRLRGDRPHPGVQGVQLQPGRDEQIQRENRLGGGRGVAGARDGGSGRGFWS